MSAPKLFCGVDKVTPVVQDSPTNDLYLLGRYTDEEVRRALEALRLLRQMSPKR